VAVNIINRPDVKEKNKVLKEKKAGLAVFLAKYPTVADAENHIASEINSAADLEALKTKLKGVLGEIIQALYLIAK
jgi:hypothetical protein